MIKAINPIACTGCTLCEKVCPADLFRMGENTMTIAYPADCCNCLQCKYVCPVDAISFTPAEPKKLDMNGEWKKIKALMGATDYPGPPAADRCVYGGSRHRPERKSHP